MSARYGGGTVLYTILQWELGVWPGSHYWDYHPGALSLSQITETYLKIGNFIHRCLSFWDMITGWETSTRPLANVSENLAGRVENRPGQVEFCIGYTRDYPVRASTKKF